MPDTVLQAVLYGEQEGEINSSDGQQYRVVATRDCSQSPWYLDGADTYSVRVEPTHWMELDEPPEDTVTPMAIASPAAAEEQSQEPWSYEFTHSGGYDCMTDSYSILHNGKLKICLDLSEFGQPTDGTKATDDQLKEAEQIASIIVSALNKELPL